MAAALAARHAARREFEATAGGTGGLAVQVGRRLRETVTEVREDWDDFVADRAEREPHRHDGNGRRHGKRRDPDGRIGEIVAQDAGRAKAPQLTRRSVTRSQLRRRIG